MEESGNMTLEELEAKLEPYWSNNPVWKAADVGPGWYDLVSNLLDDLVAISSGFTILQVKSKFGGLRFYIEPYNEQLQEAIARAEKESVKICEVCGKPGGPVGGGWIDTLCEEHANEAS
jgi:hypothetical protein